ncbi:tetratricopeptide repeat protein [bacterium]|nr:tetratricopeptide repeat protein [bacterium]
MRIQFLVEVFQNNGSEEPYSFRLPSVAMVTLLLFLSSVEARAVDGVKYVVTQNTHGFNSPIASDSPGAKVESTQLYAGTILTKVPPPDESVSTWRGEKFVFFTKYTDNTVTVWVNERFVMSLREFAENLVKEGVEEDLENQQGFYRPWLIRFQQNPAIAESWSAVNRLIKENSDLPPNNQLADPYFSRAEIWLSVANYSDAVADLITGINICKDRGMAANLYYPFTKKLDEAIRLLESSPLPAVGVDLGWSAAASKQYSLGVSSYFSNRMDEALISFSNCVAMSPQTPHYWYFRALVNRSLGRMEHAQHDAILGVHFEQKIDATNQVQTMNERLSRVQGESRTWLEQFRQGMISNHLLGFSHPSRGPADESTGGAE